MGRSSEWLEICHLVHLLYFLFWGYQDRVEAEPHLAQLGIFDTDTWEGSIRLVPACQILRKWLIVPRRVENGQRVRAGCRVLPWCLQQTSCPGATPGLASFRSCFSYLNLFFTQFVISTNSPLPPSLKIPFMSMLAGVGFSWLPSRTQLESMKSFKHINSALNQNNILLIVLIK